MDFVTIIQMVLRRWYVVAALVLVTAVAATVVATRAEAEYEVAASVMLTGTAQDADGAAQLDASVAPAVISEIVQDGDVRAATESDTSYTVETAGDGSILRVNAYGPDPAAIVETVTEIVDAIDVQVDVRQDQAEVPAERRAETRILSMPNEDGLEFEVDPNTGDVALSGTGSVLLAVPTEAPSRSYPPNSFTLVILQERLHSDDVVNTLQEQGATAEYLATFDARAAAPIMRFDVSGTDPDNVMFTLDSVMGLMAEELDQRQADAGVPEFERTTIEAISIPSFAPKTSSNLLRPLLTVVALGLVTALALAVITEGMAQALTRRRELADARARQQLLAEAYAAHRGESEDTPASSAEQPDTYDTDTDTPAPVSEQPDTNETDTDAPTPIAVQQELDEHDRIGHAARAQWASPDQLVGRTLSTEESSADTVDREPVQVDQGS